MDSPTWTFIRIKDQGVRNVDPSEFTFFKKLRPLGAVIRESAQNSLDAKSSNSKKPVRMRISLNKRKKNLGKYFDGLTPHLQASKVIDDDFLFDDIDFITIEDFETTGLQGDAKIFDKNMIGSKDNDFFWFHRNTNRTGKVGSKGGSYGYGKAAFANASKIKTFFTVSNSKKEGLRSFGSSIAKDHILPNGKRHQPYGDFGYIDNDKTKGISIIPITEKSFVKRMMEDFNLGRKENEEGLSVIIPFPNEKWGIKNVMKSMIRNYFMPIIDKNLVIEFYENNNKIELVDHSNINQVVKNLTWDGDIPGAISNSSDETMLGLVNLSLAWRNKETVNFQLNCPPVKKEPRWNRDLIGEKMENDIRKSIENGDYVNIRCPIPISKKNKSKAIYHFDVLLHKSTHYYEEDSIWIRRFLSVPTKPYPVKRGMVAIMISEDGELEELLRLSENPAHIEHEIYGTKANDVYQYANTIIRYFRISAQQISEYINAPKNQLQYDWINEWFNLPDDSPINKLQRKRKKKKKKEGGSEFELPPPPEDIPTPNIFHDIIKTDSGFRIEGSLDSSKKYIFKIKMGYARDDGSDTFKKWKSFDFNLKDFQQLGENINSVIYEENRIEFIVNGPCENFYFSLNGFDKDRDLKIHYRPFKVGGQ